MSNKKNNILISQVEEKKEITECEHKIEILEMPEGSSHKFKKVCTICKKFLGWHANIQKNESIAARKLIIGVISPYATKWEQNFFRSMLKVDKLSEKQLIKWKKIIEEYQLVGILKKSDDENKTL